MGVYHLAICCVLFASTVYSSILDARPELAKSRQSVDTNILTDCSCENGVCVTDKEGHSMCICRPGFAPQDEFICKPCDCGPLGKCLFIPKMSNSKIQFQKMCVCNTGNSEKDGVCVDCFCGENSGCEFLYGNKKCYCPDGYSEKDDVCARCDCGLYGHCEYQNGDKKCTCNERYLELNGMCEECDCGDHGSCSFVNEQKTCKCEPGYSVNSGRCEPCNCGLYGSCEYQNGDKTCECNEGYLELNGVCEECNCGDHGTCSFVNGQQSCKCEAGYSVNNGKCEPCDCGLYGSCEYQNGEKKCECNEGYLELNGLCEECDCGDHGTCSFVNGQPTCKCEPGYSVNNGKCERCHCGVYGKCKYENGYKKCECNKGYLELNGMCEECDCGDHGTCSFENGKQTCKCEPGYSVNNGKCESCDCGTNSENCKFVDGVKVCQCSDRYADRYGTCEGCYCGDHSKSCNFKDNKKTCSCLDGYVQKGDTCKLGCGPQHKCQNGGYCKEGFCFCLKGTRGEFCEIIDECSHLCPKQSDIKCGYNSTSQKAFCSCVDKNRNYDSKSKQCRSSSVCQTDDQCVNGVCRNEACQCTPGTSGERCEVVDCVRGAIVCNYQLILLWKGTDTLFVHWTPVNVLMKYVRENVVLPYVTDCRGGGVRHCKDSVSVLWCHSGNTVYVPTRQGQVLRYRLVNSTGAKCGNTLRTLFMAQ